jgi:hypothetical protein
MQSRAHLGNQDSLGGGHEEDPSFLCRNQHVPTLPLALSRRATSSTQIQGRENEYEYEYLRIRALIASRVEANARGMGTSK